MDHESIPLRHPGQHNYAMSNPLVESPPPISYPPSSYPPTPSGLPVLNSDASWAFNGMKRAEQGFGGSEKPRSAAVAQSSTKFLRFCDYLFKRNIITRWSFYIVPILALLWLPGILGVTAFRDTHLWGVKLIWWSVWLSVFWGGWWASLAFSLILPRLARWTIGAVSVIARRYIAFLNALCHYVALFIWSVVTWTSFTALVDNNAHKEDINAKSDTILSFIARLLFGIFLCTVVLLIEKIAIQWIAIKFHEKSYADRIEDQKRATMILIVLYQHSRDVGRDDVLHSKQGSLFDKALGGIVEAGNAFTNLASQLIGSAILQPTSPAAIVSDALSSSTKTRLLARRIFYSFLKPGHDGLFVKDIAAFFPSPELAEEAFQLFDKDENGDATRDEVELACMDCHREQLSIANSLRDLDSAVGRLDNIFMSLYSVIAVLIIAVVLDSQVSTLLAGVGTLILGLSWLIGSSLAEVLTSIIFLFIKHPYDVGDRVVIDDQNYTVKEIMLLSTVFLDPNNTFVQAPHNVLNTKYISNIRRSPTMSETFTFDVAFGTTFPQIEQLRDRMLAFVTAHKRDFLPSFDVDIVDIPEQEKITLSADIKYKSNWQQGALKSQRRNKWICALKQTLSDLQIYGPSDAGKPSTDPGVTKFTQVPWEEVKAAEEKTQRFAVQEQGLMPSGSIRLTDKNAVLLDSGQDVFGEAEQLASSSLRGTPQPRADTPGGSSKGVGTGAGVAG